MHCQIYRKQDWEQNLVSLKPGDFILTHGSSLFDTLIQTFTFSHWNHAALIIDEEGTLLEAVDKGIKKHHLSKYRKEEVYIVRTEFNETEREHIVKYGLKMLADHEKYGFLTIFSIALKIITKSRLIIKLEGTIICSEFVANALARGGIIWDKDPELITPADLYNALVKHQQQELN